MTTKTNICNQAMIAIGGSLITDVDTDTTKRAITMKELYDIKRNYLLRKFTWIFATKRVQLTPVEYTLKFDAQTAAFVIGEIVTGAVGIGTIDAILMTSATAGILYLSTVTIGYVDNETISGDIIGSAAANGVEAAAAPVNEFDYMYALPSDYIKLIELYPNYLDYRLESGFILSGESSTLDIRYTYKVTDENQFDSAFIEAFAALLAKEAGIKLIDSIRKKKELRDEYDDKIADARFAGSIEDDLEEISAEDWLTERL